MPFARTALLAFALPALLAAQALPKGEAVMDRFLEATGGLKAMATKKTSVMKGTMEMPGMGLKGALTLTKAEPNLQLMEMELGGMGRMLDGFDGVNAWSYNAMQGPQVKQGDEKAQAARAARFHTEDWRKEYKAVQTVGQEDVNGEACYKLHCTPVQGEVETQYFSVKSGLLVKSLVKAKTAMGEIPVETLMKDYKKAGDVLLPHTTVQSIAGNTMVMTFTSVEWNVAVPKETFTPPAEVQALLKK